MLLLDRTNGATKAVFVVSFAGEATYKVGRRQYRVRSFAITDPTFGYNTGVLDDFILPLVGTVIADGSDYWYEFPPPEVVALFPGFVGARWTKEWKAEYDGEKPVLCPTPLVSHHMTCESVVKKFVEDGMW